MKRLIALLLSLTLCFALALPAQAAPKSSITTYITQPVDTWNVHMSQSASDLKILVNTTDALTTYNADGVLVGNAAESYQVSADGMTWTFHLRDGMKWYDSTNTIRGSVKAPNWLTAAEWILNYHKNDGFNASMLREFIDGADEYYCYTRSLSYEEAIGLNAGGVFSEMVKIAAPDALTLVYRLTKPTGFFGSLACMNAFCPLSQALVDELGVEGYKWVEPNDLWYSGAYTAAVSEEGSVTLTKASHYWNTSASRFDTVRYLKLDSSSEAYDLFASGEVDQVTLTMAQLLEIYDDPEHEYHDNLVETRPTKYSYEFHFCYAKNNEDGTPDVNWNRAVANESFRKALYYGLDLTDYLMLNNPIHPLSGENYTSVVPGTIVASDGTDYTDMVLDQLGLNYNTGSYSRFNAAQATQFKQQAMQELQAKGVTFPVHAAYYVYANNTSAMSTAQTLADIFSGTLGEDFIVLDIKTYESSLYREVRDPALASFYINGWGLDFADPGNYLQQETYDDEGAYYSNYYSNINGVSEEDNPELIAVYREFTQLVREAEAIVDYDARMAAFAVAEAYMIDHALVIPAYMSTGWELTRINSLSTSSVGFGSSNYRMVDVKTSEDLYTQAQMIEEIENHGGEGTTFRVAARIIEAEAFRGIAAQQVEIAAPCESIGAYAFADCPNLRLVTIASTVQTIDSTAFDGCENLTIRYE